MFLVFSVSCMYLVAATLSLCLSLLSPPDPAYFYVISRGGEQLKVSSIQAGMARGSLFLYKRNEGLSASAKWNKIRQRIKVVVSFRGKRLVLKQISS